MISLLRCLFLVETSAFCLVFFHSTISTNRPSVSFMYLIMSYYGTYFSRLYSCCTHDFLEYFFIIIYLFIYLLIYLFTCLLINRLLRMLSICLFTYF